MRRIATCYVATVGLLGVAGCAAPRREPLRPLPEPTVSTRRPAPRPAPPPLEPPAPQPEPAPRVARPPASPASWTPPGGIRGRWQTIVIHHSASPKDSPASMEHHHRVVRGWQNGLGYHFVIGNGVNYPDGAVFVGGRWTRQIEGAHCATRPGTYFGQRRPGGYFNDHGIGICLVGNFNQSRPTRRQMESLERLVAFLTAQTGIPLSKVYGHGDVTHGTECPGQNLSLAVIRRSLRAVSASAN